MDILSLHDQIDSKYIIPDHGESQSKAYIYVVPHRSHL